MLVLNLQEREAKKWNNHKLRREGFIPGIIYGGKDNKNVAAEYAEFTKVFKKSGEHNLITAKLGKKEFMALIKDFQLHPLKNTFVHFDLLEVVPEKVIKTHVPLILKGKSKGVAAGGILEELHPYISIEVKAKDLPHGIELDITNLEIGHSVHVKDIAFPNGVKVLDAPETVLVVVAGAKVESTETVGEEETPAAKK